MQNIDMAPDFALEQTAGTDDASVSSEPALDLSANGF